VSRFTDALDRTAQTSPTGLTTIAGTTTHRYTWGDISARAARMAGALASRGVNGGESVPVLAGDAADVAALSQAVWRRAASVTVLQQPIARTDRDVWLSDTLLVVRMLKAPLVVVGSPWQTVGAELRRHGVDTVTIDELEEGLPVPALPTGGSDIALRQLTSGSTGTPKAVQITFDNLWATSEVVQSVLDCDSAQDVLVSWLPLFHDMGMILFVVWPMQRGVEVVITSPDHFAKNPRVWPELLTKFHGTITAGPDFAYGVLTRVLHRAPPGTYDLSGLRVAVNGGEPINANDLDELAHAGAQFGLNPSAFMPAYGMAEATLAVAATPWRTRPRTDRILSTPLTTDNIALAAGAGIDLPTKSVVSVGITVPGVAVRIAGATSAREVGAIELRGDIVAESYLTEAGIVRLASPDCWFDSGDLGYFDDDGQLYVCGRSKDIIIISGNNLYPSDIERAAATVTDVRKGNIAAVALAATGNVRESFAVLAESALYDVPHTVERIRAEILAAVTLRVGYAPRVVAVLAPGTIPKTTSGKLRRRAAAQLLPPVPTKS
jgi:fatty-acyl-CoA synthase